MQVITIGLDIAKSVFQVHAEDAAGKIVAQKRLRRSQVEPFFAKLAPALVGIETCGQIIDHDLQRVLLDVSRVGVIRGKRVPVGDKEKAVVIVLQAHPVAQSTDIVSQVHFAGRAHAA